MYTTIEVIVQIAVILAAVVGCIVIASLATDPDSDVEID